MDQSKGASAALYQHLVPVRDILGADAFEYVASAAASLLEELEDVQEPYPRHMIRLCCLHLFTAFGFRKLRGPS